MAVNHLDSVFKSLRARRRKALIAYMTGGYPRFSEQTKLVESLVKGGVDILEIGVPFSDPVADGPTIQLSSQAALQNGVSLRKILVWIQTLKRRVSIPLVIMSYVNPIERYGIQRFAKDASLAGVSGVIVPDLIPEEADELVAALQKYGLHMIFLVAPTTPPARARMIAQRSGGFLYAVSVTGVTGARKSFTAETKRWLQSLRRLTPAPVCVGFGISGPQQIRQLRSSVDGFIVGSAMIDLIRKNGAARRPRELMNFAKRLSKECGDAR